MTRKQQIELAKAFASGIKPIDTRPLYEWLKDNVSLPDGVYVPAGQFNVDFYPYLKRPCEDLTDDNIKQLNAASCTQAGKSLLQELYLPYIILEQPGPVLKIHDTDINARKVTEERIIPLLKHNEDTKALIGGRFTARKSGLSLPHMTMRVSGPAESNILGFSARVCLGDEVWRWQADKNTGVIEKLKGRQTAYNATKKLFLSSQPDYEGSDWHKECLSGLWFEWGYRCPSCKMLQRYEWNGERDGKYFGMVCDETVNGDYYAKAQSARLVCQHCFHAIHNTPSERKELLKNGDYILIHSGNDHSTHTYSWGQWVNLSIPFSQMAMQYFNAVIDKRTTGLDTKKEIFFQQTLGKFWQDSQRVDTKKLFVSAYKASDEWADETIRFLTLDPQKDYVNWLVRAWSNKVSECRLIDWGTIAGLGEVKDLCRKYKIDPLCIGIDSGNDTRDVYKASIINAEVKNLPSNKRILAQWTCLRGDGGSSPLTPKKFYTHDVYENGRKMKVDKLYSTKEAVDPQWPANSQYKIMKAILYNWSNYSIKTILTKLRDKQLPFNWALNERATSEYVYQMHSEELTKKGRFEPIHSKNHVWDMECMQLVMALMAGCYCPSAETYNEINKEPELVVA